MDTLNLTFSKKHLVAFYNKLFDLVDTEYKAIEGPQLWKSIWDTWKNKGLRTANSRGKLSMILGKYESKTKVAKLMATNIKKIRINIPIVQENVQFSKSEDSWWWQQLTPSSNNTTY